MAKTKKWSEQVLVEKSFKTQDENGNEVISNENVLEVCVGGLELYKKEFKEDEYKGKNKLLVPYDFLLLAGNECPKGAFYELEYFIGENGAVYRAIVQCVNPVTDIRVMLGCLKRRNLLPAGFNPIRAWKREDIDMVSVVYCGKDEESAYISGPIYRDIEGREYKDKKHADDKIGVSVLEYSIKYCKDLSPSFDNPTCLEYYRGDMREVWAGPQDKDLIAPIFVCGIDNDTYAQQIKEVMDYYGVPSMLSLRQ